MDWLDYYYPHFHPAESKTTRFENVKLVMKFYKTYLLRRALLAKTNAKKHAFCPIFLPFLVLFYISFYLNCCNLWLFAILFRVLVEVFHRPRNRFLWVKTHILCSILLIKQASCLYYVKIWASEKTAFSIVLPCI